MVEDTRSQRHGGGDDTRWDEYMDPETGAPYFYNPTTGETKWKQVETTTTMALQQPDVASDDGDYMIAGLATPSVISTPRSISPSSATSNHETTYARVDGGGTWTQATDENGCAYYYNTATNATSWNPSSAQHPLLAMETWECFTSKDGLSSAVGAIHDLIGFYSDLFRSIRKELPTDVVGATVTTLVELFQHGQFASKYEKNQASTAVLCAFLKLLRILVEEYSPTLAGLLHR
ncbi:hypothetical protein DYB35_004772 [Aphanomyces astaci]|uniref:WW domain-containing protein n=1 Tax=Aphanomyces astaci TaxID=112090 RepID=A0A3R6WI77_APHAT|nr:hypothetical protein DYB35_004772 [Aphanomyces astaci]